MEWVWWSEEYSICSICYKYLYVDGNPETISSSEDDCYAYITTVSVVINIFM